MASVTQLGAIAYINQNMQSSSIQHANAQQRHDFAAVVNEEIMKQQEEKNKEVRPTEDINKINPDEKQKQKNEEEYDEEHEEEIEEEHEEEIEEYEEEEEAQEYEYDDDEEKEDEDEEEEYSAQNNVAEEKKVTENLQNNQYGYQPFDLQA